MKLLFLVKEKERSCRMKEVRRDNLSSHEVAHICSQKHPVILLPHSHRAKANDEPEGFVKLLTDKSNGMILGCHIIAPNAGDLITPITVAMHHKTPVKDVAQACFAHPALSEAVKEACIHATSGQFIHM